MNTIKVVIERLNVSVPKIVNGRETWKAVKVEFSLTILLFIHGPTLCFPNLK